MADTLPKKHPKNTSKAPNKGLGEDLFSLFITQLTNVIQNHAGEQLVAAIFEWQNFLPVLFGSDRKTMRNILSDLKDILSEEFGSLFQISTHDGILVAIFKFENRAKHLKHIDKFIQRSASFGISNAPFPIYVKLSAGSALIGSDINLSVDHAMIALYEAKINPKTKNVFYCEESGIMRDKLNQLELAAYFFDAIKNRRLRLSFQPVINAKSGQIYGYEALLRILTKEQKIITAGPFIPIAEKYGFIDVIDSYVLKAVVKELKSDPEVRIAMNVSNQTVTNEEWLKEAKKLLSDEKIANRLTIEITETGEEHDLKAVAAFVEQIKSLGCEVAIDDFGAGYTSFKQLKLINADVLKIDGAFVRDIVDNPESVLFVNLLIEFAHSYKLKTVAEFVETGEIAKKLMELGVDYFQGYYFSESLNYRPWINDDRIS